MNAKSMTASRHGSALDPRRAGDHRVAETGRHLGLGEPLRVGPEVEELERVARAQIGRPPRRTCRRRRAARSARAPRTGKWWPHCGHTRRCALELVVAVVGPAAGTGVRMLLRRRVVESACLCSIETSILSVADICAILDPAPRRTVTGRRLATSRATHDSASRRRWQIPSIRGRERTPGDDRREDRLGLREVEASRLGHEDRELDPVAATSQSRAT